MQTYNLSLAATDLFSITSPTSVFLQTAKFDRALTQRVVDKMQRYAYNDDHE
jgi:hypothetical protein